MNAALPRHVTLYCEAASEGVAQVVAGLALLRAGGELKVSARSLRAGVPNYNGWGVCLEADGAKIAIDLRDARDTLDPAARWCDVYVKRSYHAPTAASSPHAAKTVPYGLNYAASARGSFGLRRLYWNLRTAKRRRLREALARTVRMNPLLSAIMREPMGYADYRMFEAPPVPAPEPRIFCFTRTWNPALVAAHPAQAEHWAEVTRLRVDCIRALRSEFGERFSGGLNPTPDVIAQYPDCATDDPRVRTRPGYLRLLRQHDIGVVFAGLWHSNGFRLGEFVASSRAIVAEPPDSEVPGDFGPSVHFEPLTDAQTCVESATALFENREKRETMMRSNSLYYESYVRPDALMRGCLTRAMQVLGR